MTHGNEVRTPNAECPACKDNRVHTKEEFVKYHPLTGHGFNKEQGWTYCKTGNE